MKFPLLGLLALVGCADGFDQRNNSHEPSSAEMLRREEPQLASDPCIRRKGDVRVHIAWRNCLEFLPPQRMHGIWVMGFEESSFIPRATVIPRANNRVRYRVFLEVEPKTLERLSEAGVGDMTEAQAYAVEFIGRRSLHAGLYYTGEGDHVVVMDRLISARHLGRAPEPDAVAAIKEGRHIDLDQPLSDDLWRYETP